MSKQLESWEDEKNWAIKNVVEPTVTRFPAINEDKLGELMYKAILRRRKILYKQEVTAGGILNNIEYTSDNSAQHTELAVHSPAPLNKFEKLSFASTIGLGLLWFGIEGFANNTNLLDQSSVSMLKTANIGICGSFFISAIPTFWTIIKKPVMQI